MFPRTIVQAVMGWLEALSSLRWDFLRWSEEEVVPGTQEWRSPAEPLQHWVCTSCQVFTESVTDTANKPSEKQGKG